MGNYIQQFSVLIRPTQMDVNDEQTLLLYLTRLVQEVTQNLDELRGAIRQTQQNRIDAGGDLLVINAANGVVFKDAQSPAHYWRLNCNNVSGQIQMDDLGTVAP